MTEPVIIALITLVGGGTFGGVIAAFFARRKTAAEADLTVGGAWEKFVQNQDRALEAVRSEAAKLRGELDAANRRVSVLERQQNEALFWQARMITRTGLVDDMLRRNGMETPPIPQVPVVREPHTRADDR